MIKQIWKIVKIPSIYDSDSESLLFNVDGDFSL
jgi:hypothetical protein